MSNEIQKRSGAELSVNSAEELLTVFEPVQMMKKYSHIKSIAEAMSEDKNAISVYGKHFGKDSIQAVIELHLFALNKSVNVANPLTEFQRTEIAIEIMNLYYFLSMVEIQFVFRKAKRGDFGPLYNSLNIVSILDWFRQYTNDRVHLAMQKTEQENIRRKSENEVRDGKLFGTPLVDDAALKVLQSVKQEMPKNDKFDREEYDRIKQEYEQNKE